MEDFKNQQCPDFNIESDTSLTQRHLNEEESISQSNDLLSHANQVDSARLLATASPHRGAWLSVLPIECLSLLVPDDAVRIGVALRLGVPVQQPHHSKCGGMTDKFGHHSLSCHHDPGRLPRHTAFNDVVY
ncbi:hypothetical protein Pcinc_016295 [Petrolisthes cinctipes]|uniref:Uncharacterized protein n=1 Tax=Petrolisthes cinctipes TaxID=88211 RepID=A0AAE1FT52_PETCI|nr:hypothetical protein Pcinc_033789 [Petrolisthes cinctipes]KAK3879136.1 hypothetical protein Pcinc_016295 [Petrolisthes cinctipes]